MCCAISSGHGIGGFTRRIAVREGAGGYAAARGTLRHAMVGPFLGREEDCARMTRVLWRHPRMPRRSLHTQGLIRNKRNPASCQTWLNFPRRQAEWKQNGWGRRALLAGDISTSHRLVRRIYNLATSLIRLPPHLPPPRISSELCLAPLRAPHPALASRFPRARECPSAGHAAGTFRLNLPPYRLGSSHAIPFAEHALYGYRVRMRPEALG